MVRPSNGGIAMARGSKRQTSARVSAIASRVLNDDEPKLTAEVQAQIATAVRMCGLPINDRAMLALNVNLEAALAPIFADMKTLAASCLSQDETAGQSDATGEA